MQTRKGKQVRLYLYGDSEGELSKLTAATGLSETAAMTMILAAGLAAVAHDPSVARILAVQYFAGLRPSEAERLTESELTEAAVIVEGAKAKTRRRRTVPLTPALGAWLAAGGRLPVGNLRRRMDAVRAGAGVPWAHDVTRHTFCSYALPAFGEDWTAQAAGHSPAVLVRHYRETVSAAAAAAFWALRPGGQTYGANPVPLSK